MKDKKILILSIVGVLVLVSIVVATSYAYFTATVSGNKDTNNVVITNGVMSLEYKDGDEITLDNAVPGDSVTKTFTIKNTGNVSTNYTIYFSELINSFVDKTDLVYTLTSSDGGKNIVQTQVPDNSEAMVSNYTIEVGKTHTYTLTVTFLEKNENQDDNQNASFSTKVTINEYVKVTTFDLLGKTIETTEVATDDRDNNIRYIGANPNNYVYFNCNDYSNQSDSTCEKWRIIGVFKNVTKSDGTKENLVKIVRNDSLGDFSWDYKQTGVGTSKQSWGSSYWGDSQLMMMLNPTDYLKYGTIENNIVKDSNGQAMYKNVGSYYNGTYGCEPASIVKGKSFSCTLINFNSTGLKNSGTRNAIESVVWNIGSPKGTSVSTMYSEERGSEVPLNHLSTKWTGKVGLMYPSDYGYATSGGKTTNRDKCLATYMENWYDSTVSDCKENDYLYHGIWEWTLSPSWRTYYTVFLIAPSGLVSTSGADKLVYNSNRPAVYPALYLKSDISISQGNGSSSNPYQLNIQ